MSIKKQVLRALLLKLHMYYFVLYFLGRFSKLQIDRHNRKRVFFFMTPNYGNLGDQAIDVASSMFIEEMSEYEIIRISLDDTLSKLWSIKKEIQQDDVVILQGGGNFGDLYPSIENVRRYVCKKLSTTRIVSLPSTVCYLNERELKKSAKIYNKCKELVLFSRDRESYDFCCKHFDSCNNFLAPDMVLSLKKDFIGARKGILVCLRSDKEALYESIPRQEMIDALFCDYKDIVLFDTMADRRIEDSIKKEEVESALNLFSKFELVITNRLHGVLFSYVTNTKCIAFQDKYGKIKGALDWIKDNQKIRVIPWSIAEVKKAVEELSKSMCEDKSIDPKEFDIIRKELVEKNG